MSICIPSYNHARYLAAAIESALGQTYTDFEVVIVDDGSRDDSVAVAESYAARHPDRVRVFTHPGRGHLGIAPTAHLAFAKARGEFWTGLPSDDLLYPDKLERQVRFMDRHPGVGWIYSYVDLVDKGGSRLPGVPPFGRDITRDPDQLESLIVENAVPAMSVMTRRDLMARVGLEDGSLVYSDWHLWVRLTAHSRAACFDRPLAMYRVHDYNTSIGITTHTDIERTLEVARALKREAASIGGGMLRPRTRALVELQLAHLLFCTGEAEGAAAHLAAAFETDPTLARAAGYVARWLMRRFLYTQHILAGAPAERRHFSRWVLRHLPASAGGSLRRRLRATHFAERAFESYYDDLGESRRMALRSMACDPRQMGDKALLSILIKSLAGDSLLAGARRIRNRPALRRD